MFSVCHVLRINSADATLGWNVLAGHLVEGQMEPVANNGVRREGIYWSSLGAGCTLPPTSFDITFGWAAVTSALHTLDCATQFGCTEYTDLASGAFLKIIATAIGQPTVTRQATVHRPVNPCNPGSFDFGFANVDIFPAIDGSTGFLAGPCGAPPPPNTGACCLPDGTCVQTDAGHCATAGGAYQGDGSTCGTVNCPPPPPPNDLGACCIVLGNGSTACNEVNQATCIANGGTWLGAGTHCANIECPPPGAIANEWNVKNKSRGLGDTIHRLTNALGIPHCKSCAERAAILNKVLPYSRRT